MIPTSLNVNAVEF